MNARKYLIEQLQHISKMEYVVGIRYKYDAGALIHIVEIIGTDHSTDSIIEEVETNLLFDFLDHFPDENLGFVKEDSVLEFEHADWSIVKQSQSLPQYANLIMTHHFLDSGNSSPLLSEILTWNHFPNQIPQINNFQTYLNVGLSSQYELFISLMPNILSNAAEPEATYKVKEGIKRNSMIECVECAEAA